jgi:hypothetical protein
LRAISEATVVAARSRTPDAATKSAWSDRAISQVSGAVQTTRQP